MTRFQPSGRARSRAFPRTLFGLGASPSAAALWLLLAPWVLLALGLGACAGSGSAGGSSDGRPMLVTLHNFKTGERFELASESHTNRVSYYSGKRGDAARKVQTDEVMSAFVRELERQGLASHAQAGRAPSAAGSNVIRWGLEIEENGAPVHWLVGTGSAPEDWQEFQGCRDMFLELYNATVSYQAVENASGKQFFDDQARAAASQK